MGTALQPMQRTGPLTEREEDAAYHVLERVLLGQSLRRIEEEGGPSRLFFMSLLQRSPLLVQLYNRAREISAFDFEDRALFLSEELAEDGSNNPGEIRRKTFFIEQLKWGAKVRNPAVFGDKSLVQVTVPIQINTNLDLGESNAAAGLGHTYSIQAKPIRSVSPEEIPPDHTVVDIGDGYVSIEPKEKGFPSSVGTAEGEGQGRSGDRSVSGTSPGRCYEEEGRGKGEAPSAKMAGERPRRAARGPRGKAAKIQGEET